MTKEYLINVRHVDNRLVIYLNGETVFDSGIVHDDPEMDAYVDITDHLLEHINDTSELIFEGFNDNYDPGSNPDGLNSWHFDYRVITRVRDSHGTIVEETDLIRPYNEKHLSNPNIKAIENAYRIIRKDKEFRVVSNSMYQNFYA